MQYALMIYAEPGRVEALSDAEREAARAEFLALADDAGVDGLVSGIRPSRLAPTSGGDENPGARRPETGHTGLSRRSESANCITLRDGGARGERAPPGVASGPSWGCEPSGVPCAAAHSSCR